MDRRTVLLERDAELAHLRAALASARAGAGAVVLVSGEAGAGKTSLVRHFLADLPDDVQVLAGTGEDLYSPRVLGPFREMLPGLRLDERDEVLAHLLERSADPRTPLVLVLDDAHWADQASLDVVRYVGRRAACLGLLLVVVFRTDDLDADHPLARVLGTLQGAHVSRLEVTGLSESAVRLLADDAGVDYGRVRGLGGNPFLVTEVLAAPDADVPPSVRDAFVARVAELPEQVREVLALLAVVPRGIDLDLLESLVPDALRLVVGPERAGLVDVGGGRVSYHHELARRGIEGSVPPARRTALHRRLLAALEERHADSSLCLHHAVAAQVPRAVVRHALRTAGDADRAEAHREALVASELALDHPTLLTDAQRGECLSVAARACYNLNRPADAARFSGAAVQVLRTARPRQDPSHVEALLLDARMATMTGDPVTARASAQEAVEVGRSDAGHSELHALRARAHELLAQLDALEGDNAGALAHAAEAVALAGGPGSRARAAMSARTAVPRGMALAGHGDRSAVPLLESAAAELRRLGLFEHEARAATNLAVIHLGDGELGPARGCLEAAAAIAREHHQESLGFFTAAHLANLRLLGGGWDVAEAELRGLISADSGAGAVALLPQAFLGRLLLRRGDPEGAALIARSWEGAEASRQVRRMAHAALARLEQCWLEGDRAGAAAWGRTAQELADRVDLRHPRGEARRWLRRCGLPADATGTVPDGFALALAGDWEGAARWWRARGQPFEEALELVEAPDDPTVGRGLALLDGLGAVATSDAVRRGLRSVGRVVPPRQRRPRDACGLTRRQREVLDLVGEGLTTPQIAARLFLSPRTVDNHVNAVLERFGVTTRREAVLTDRRRRGEVE